MTTYQTDVLIIGGGPAGTSAALGLLTYTNYRVSIIEGSAYEKERVGEHVDGSLLELLAYLNIDAKKFKSKTFMKAYSNTAAWGSELVISRVSMYNTGTESYQLDREDFETVLTSEVAKREGKIFPQSKCLQFFQEESGTWKVVCQHKTRGRFCVKSRFLIDAAGRLSTVCRKLRLQTQKHDSLVGIGAYLQFQDQQTYRQELFLESTEFGWWYTATLPGNKMVATFFTDSDIVTKHGLRNPKRWNELLSQTRYSKYKLLNSFGYHSPWVRNAFSQITDFYEAKNFLAVGDAAASFDPLSSMGIGFAMNSGCNAARAITSQLQGDSSLISSYCAYIKDVYQTYLERLLRYYAKERRWEQSLFWKRRIGL
jgi:flavin-dependent dehydrogenase